MRLPSLLASLALLVASAPVLGPGCGGDPAAPSCDAKSACPSGQWCLFPDGLCGKGAASGTCTAVSDLACAGGSVCGCDGKVYDSVCAAATAGIDATDSSACPAPAGQLACGGSYCPAASEICLTRRSASGSACVTSVSCVPIPSSCAAAPTCACVLAGGVASASATCSGDAAAGFAVNDPGGC